MESQSLSSPLVGISDYQRENGEVKGRREVLLAEVKKLVCLAGPLIASSLLQTILQMISVMFAAHLGELSFFAASKATSFANVTGFSLMVGMAAALETFCGQAFGAKQNHMLGIYLQRAMLVLVVVCIPVSIVWANAGQILMAIGQDKDISSEAGVYAKWLIPALFAFGPLHCCIRFLQTQSIVIPVMVASAVTALLHLLVCWLLVFKFGLGSRGAALSNSMAYWVNLMMLALYVRLSPSCKKSWNGFSREAFHGLLSFIRLAIPSGIMVWMEFWLFESVVNFSGLLPNPKLETTTIPIIYNTAMLIFMIPYGLAAAVSTRVSNELGAGRPKAACLAAHVVIILAMLVGLAVGLILILVRNIWGYAYSNEVEVVKYVSILLPIVAASNLVDGLQAVLSGVARGCGWQTPAAFVNAGAYNVVGIPSAALLAFTAHLGGKGLWMGIVCGLTVQLMVLLIITLSTDWENEAKKAKQRVHNNPIPIE
ncbi:MATE efflux family protein DTX1 [Apostasia shenzhenica]|uniref:Protein DETOXIFICATION n=1 Tax=Apostasia shenzhenica TaxID=1088818 RepID=A0A2I0A145_9ASPA|nr:MATE efflux family protein DTX1 [Apostasia shenzhenica]